MERFFTDYGEKSGYKGPEEAGTGIIPKMVYVGNMSFSTTEEQIYEAFSHAGNVKKIIMGLDKNTYTPCGFCFVEYISNSGAEAARRLLHKSVLDEREINVDLEFNFTEGRQYGRGQDGRQRSDQRRAWRDRDRGDSVRLAEERGKNFAYGEPYRRAVAVRRGRQSQQFRRFLSSKPGQGNEAR
ncbi:MAG: nuclear cap-binding protein subunit 2 [Amphiamblys sp. WSBS2006]|nr:MAG: nuclear cap-binding protein subunit 2 [Amphiamblys sp. WSBS2006]